MDGEEWGKAYTTFTSDDMKAFFRLLYGCALTESDALVLQTDDFELKEKLYEFFTKYDIPLKNGSDRQGWALRINPEQSLHGWTKGDKESDKTQRFCS